MEDGYVEMGAGLGCKGLCALVGADQKLVSFSLFEFKFQSRVTPLLAVRGVQVLNFSALFLQKVTDRVDRECGHNRGFEGRCWHFGGPGSRRKTAQPNPVPQGGRWVFLMPESRERGAAIVLPLYCCAYGYGLRL